MYIYTLAFIKRNNHILMLNRKKQPWLGSWNGVGGKRKAGESPIDCVIREIYEETNIKVAKEQVKDKGTVSWNSLDALGQGLHLFLIEMRSDYAYQTPITVDEGVLDWKPIDWINQKDNYGVAWNIPYFLPVMLNDPNRYHYHCIFSERFLESVTKELIK